MASGFFQIQDINFATGNMPKVKTIIKRLKPSECRIPRVCAILYIRRRFFLQSLLKRVSGRRKEHLSSFLIVLRTPFLTTKKISMQQSGLLRIHRISCKFSSKPHETPKQNDFFQGRQRHSLHPPPFSRFGLLYSFCNQGHFRLLVKITGHKAPLSRC